MPKPERWEEKAMGKIPRFENTTYEKITNQLYKGTRAFLNWGTGALFNTGASFVSRYIKPLDAVTVKGKRFRYEYGLLNLGIRKAAGAVSGAAINQARSFTENIFTREYFFPAGTTVAETVFSGRIPFDENMGIAMHNDCGYQPNFQEILQGMHQTASAINNTLTDITWRKEVTPHIIRTAFQEELGKCFAAIRQQHQEAPVHNRQLMEAQMNLAAQHLGNIFQKFTLDMANNADYLEAPISFFPQKAALPDTEMTDLEKNLLGEVSHHSMFSGPKELQKLISREAVKLPQKDSQQTLAAFNRSLSSQDENQRKMNSILNLRGLQQKYNSRNFFSRHLTRSGREERAAINTMKERLLETLKMDPKTLDSLLDPKNPLEKDASIKEALNIQQKEPLPPPKTFTENVVEVAKKTGEVISNVTSATISTTNAVLSEAKNVVIGTGEVISNVVNTTGAVISGTANLAKDVAVGAVNAAGNIATGAVNVGKTLANEGVSGLVMGNAFDDFNPFADDDELDEILGSGPAPKKEEKNVIKEEPEEENSVEENKEEAKKEEEKKEEAPKQEEPGFFGKMWNGVKYLGSFANPYSYMRSDPPAQEPNTEPIAEEKQEEESIIAEEKAPEKEDSVSQKTSSLIQKIHQLQKDAALRQNANLTSIISYQQTVAKLLYYKSLEASLHDPTLSEEGRNKIESGLTEENAQKGAQKIAEVTAFKKLDVYNPKKVRDCRAFLTSVAEDPSVLNGVFKNYLQNEITFKNEEQQRLARKQKDLNKDTSMEKTNEPKTKTLL